MKTSADYQLNSRIALLLVGEPKAGKTCIMTAFPRPAVIDIDMNLASAIRRAPTKPILYDQPMFRPDGTVRPLEDRWEYIDKLITEIALNPDVDTICFDGLTAATEVICAHIIKRARAAGTNKTGEMELRDYGTLANVFKALVMKLRATRKNVIVTSHQVADKDETTGAIRYMLSIPGQMKDTLGGLFTDVWAAHVKPGTNPKYCIRTKPSGLHVALGTSFPLDTEIDVTDKSPDQIWSILAPKLSVGVAKPTPA